MSTKSAARNDWGRRHEEQPRNALVIQWWCNRFVNKQHTFEPYNLILKFFSVFPLSVFMGLLWQERESNHSMFKIPTLHIANTITVFTAVQPNTVIAFFTQNFFMLLHCQKLWNDFILRGSHIRKNLIVAKNEICTIHTKRHTTAQIRHNSRIHTAILVPPQSCPQYPELMQRHSPWSTSLSAYEFESSMTEGTKIQRKRNTVMLNCGRSEIAIMSSTQHRKPVILPGNYTNGYNRTLPESDITRSSNSRVL